MAMHKLEIEDPEVMRVAIQQEISRSDESRYDHRLHGLLLVTSGQSCREVARLLGEDPSTVQRWVRRFERDGLEGLRDGERPGRPRMISARQWRKLGVDLRATPRDFGLEASIWDGPLLSEHLRGRYGIELGVRQCQRLFRQMGFRLRKPRPEVAQSDPVKVAAAKKTAPTGKARGG
jgi:transposase